MNNYSFSFKRNRPVMRTEFPDGSIISFVEPDVKTAEALICRYDDITNGVVSTDELFDFAAEIMNNNKNGVTFTSESLHAAGLDERDLSMFLTAYAGYINSLAASKN